MRKTIITTEGLETPRVFVMRQGFMPTQRTKRHVSLKRDVDFLCAQFPKAFSRKLGEIRPLKHDILDDVMAHLGDESLREPMRLAISFYSHRLHYLRKVVSGKWRRDLYGNRVALVTAEEKERAAVKIEQILEMRHRKEKSLAA